MAEASPPYVFGAVSVTWWALRLRSNQEFRVEAFLTGHGIESFLPTWRERVRWTDREKTTVRPLFPGYIFVRCDRAQIIDALRVPGVVQILPTSIDPIEVSDADIANVRDVLASGLMASPCAYVAGETVTIESGPLAGVSGVVVRTKGATRLVVRVPMIGGAVNVEVGADDLPKKN